MFDQNKSYSSDQKERALMAGAAIMEEGQCLIYVSDGAGGITVAPSEGDASDYNGTIDRTRVAGFAITDAKKRLTEVVVETLTVPGTAPFTVQLKHQNIIVAESYALDAGPAYSGEMVEAGMAPNANERWLQSTGLLTFHADNAGDTVTIQYRYELTAAEIVEKFHQRSVNNTAQDYFSTVSIMCGEGEIFTSMFDAAVAYTAPGIIYSGAGGKLTSVAGGAVVGTCTKLPSVSDGLLGVKFKTA